MFFRSPLAVAETRSVSRAMSRAMPHAMRRVAAALLALGLAWLPGAAHAVPGDDAWAYSLTFLPSGFAPAAINGAGQIVGTYQGAAAVLDGGGIATLPGTRPDSFGLGINNHGGIVGAYDASYSGSAFSYVDGKLVSLADRLPPSYAYSNANGINDAGIIIGNAQPLIGEAARGYVYDGAGFRFIPTFGGDWSSAVAINAAGAVVGASTLPGGGALTPLRHAYLDNAAGTRDLGTLGGVNSEAYDINDAGLVVGWSETTVDPDNQPLSRPFLYRDGAMLDLGSLGGYYGYARAINNAGVVVGESDLVTDSGWGSHAFLYRDGAMLDLNTLLAETGGWELVDASDINDAGQILGRACRAGDCVAVRLDPVPAVPEPGAWALLLGGFGLLAWRGRRRGAGAVGKARAAVAVALAAATAAAASPAALAAPLYGATFLPEGLLASGIDNGGRIAGRGNNGDYTRAFVWEDGATAFLPTLGGPTAFATAIAGGVVAGASASGDVTRGFVYAGGAIQRIGTLYGGDSYAYGVNAAGQAVGESTDMFGNSRAFLYSGGTLSDIGDLGGGDARARAINDAGVIVGGSQPGAAFPNGGDHAFLYRDGVMSDLGTLGGGFSWANALNDAGQVAGYSLTAGDAAWRPFLYSDGVMRDLGSFGGAWGEAHDINAAGLVVGTSSLPGFGFSHAFVYADGALLDLNALVAGLGIFTLTDAVGINDLGQIAANGCTEFGYCAPVLLTPVPEPASVPLLLAGLLVLALLSTPRYPLVRSS